MSSPFDNQKYGMGEGTNEDGEGDDGRESNPFVLPSDEEVFRMRDEERRRKQDKKEKLQEMKIWEKTTASSQMSKTKRFVEDDVSMNESMMSKQAKHTRGLVAAATAAISNDRRREKENMATFIAKKREMFLVQMSLDTKREEIRKLEEKAQMKEEALKKSELMLEEDAIRFDTFLKENDKKAHEAIKKAEKETKAKTDKVQEIKKLNQQIQMIQSDMSKLKEQLDDCLKYKEFLDSLTPPEWFEQQGEIKKKRQIERRRQRRIARTKAWEEKCQKIKVEHEAKEKQEKERLEKEGRVKRKGDRKLQSVTLPPQPTFDSDEDPLSSSGDEMPMYFTRPAQLLDIFTQLEEQNLFLIQNSQETEQALEELKQNFRETKKKMDRKTQQLDQNIRELRAQIEVEEAKCESLKQRAQASAGEDKQEDLLKSLNEKVKEVYRRCGFDADSSPSTLSMLTELEARLEDLLMAIEAMPEDIVNRAEKDKEKERRERVRLERISQQQQQYEERMKKSMERSMQAPRKRKGRQVMWRSNVFNRKEMQMEKKTEETDDDDDQQFFS